MLEIVGWWAVAYLVISFVGTVWYLFRYQLPHGAKSDSEKKEIFVRTKCKTAKGIFFNCLTFLSLVDVIIVFCWVTSKLWATGYISSVDSVREYPVLLSWLLLSLIVLLVVGLVLVFYLLFVSSVFSSASSFYKTGKL